MIVTPATPAAAGETPDIDAQVADAEMRVKICEGAVARANMQLLTAVAVAATLREVRARGLGSPPPPTEHHGEDVDDFDAFAGSFARRRTAS